VTGSENKPVLFGSVKENSGGWKGLEIIHEATINFANIVNAEYGIYVAFKSTVKIDNC